MGELGVATPVLTGFYVKPDTAECLIPGLLQRFDPHSS